jgi:alpha-D-xyloside xylohydrolase
MSASGRRFDPSGSRIRGQNGRCVGATVLLVLVLVAGACSSGDDGDRPEEAAPATTAPLPPEETLGFSLRREGPDHLVLTSESTRVDVRADPFSIAAGGRDGPEATTAVPYLIRDGRRLEVDRVRLDDTAADRVAFSVWLDDGSRGTLSVIPVTPETTTIQLVPRDPAGVTAWGQAIGLAPEERIYGLTERTVSDLIDSEVEPTADGTLDRRGEVVAMSIVPTISAYAPFYQSSAGYGLLVEGTEQGSYDIGVSDPDVLDVEFSGAGGRWDLFVGDHPTILREYTALTGRAPVPPDYIFRHWRGRDEFPVGEPVEYDGVLLNPAVADELEHYDELGLPPPGVFHLDRPWGTGPEGYGQLEFDTERFPDPEGMLQLLQERGSHPWVWISNWAIGARGREARRLGFLGPDTDRAIDFTNPEAAAWYRDGLTDFLASPDGRLVDGFFIDRGDEPDVASDPDDVYADSRTGAEIHNAYPVLMQENVRRVLDESRPEEGYAIARAAYTGTQGLAATWGGDTHSRDGFQIPEVPATGRSTDLGLRSVLVSIQRAAFLGLPFWGSDIGGYSEFADREVYARWIQVGALSPLMRFHGKGSDLPWDMPTRPRDDAEMTEVYGTYIRLHEALAPYLVALAQEAHDTGLTPVRPLVFRWPDQAEAKDAWDEWLLGDDLLVAPVWRSGDRARRVWFPPGRWVDVWDPETVIEGPTTRRVRAPLDTLPLYASEGAEVLDAIRGALP